MKIGIITDQHFGARKGSKLFHDYFLKFYNETFFPTLLAEGITTIIDMGDTFDNRRSIDFWSLKWAKENYYDRLRDMGITVYTVVGNHTAYYKNNNSINTIDLLLREYDNIIPITDYAEHLIGGTKFAFISWINKENEQQTLNLINKSTAKIAVGHLELNGFAAYRGFMQDRGYEAEYLRKFDRVFTGHYHTRSNDGQVFYLGNPYELYWNDVNDPRGFHLFDTETYDLEQIDNPNHMFYNIYYEDTPHQMLNASEYAGKIVKVIVRKKTKPKDFEKFIDKLYTVGVEELKVIENFDYNQGWLHGEDLDISEEENTMSILNRCIEDTETDIDKSRIKTLFGSLYSKACEVE
jgi:DNA repair exonuclease SbcCD nuclease subunit